MVLFVKWAWFIIMTRSPFWKGHLEIEKTWWSVKKHSCILVVLSIKGSSIPGFMVWVFLILLTPSMLCILGEKKNWKRLIFDLKKIGSIVDLNQYFWHFQSHSSRKLDIIAKLTKWSSFFLHLKTEMTELNFLQFATWFSLSEASLLLT